MSNKKNKGKQLKRKCEHDDLGTQSKSPRLSKKQKRKQALAKKNSKMSRQATSSCSQSTSSSKDIHKDYGSEDFSKLQCDMCKLSYGSKDKLVEHLVSLMHHTKLEEAGEKSNHRCILCEMSFPGMSPYRDHIGTKRHLRNLESLRRTDKARDKNEKNQKSKQNNSNRREDGPVTQEPRYQKTGPYNQFVKNGGGWQNWGQDYESNRYNQNAGFNNYRQQQFYDGRQNNSNYYNGRWNREYNTGRMEFENFSDGENNRRWGSGLADYKRGNAYNNNFNNFDPYYAQDNFEYCWDEQSFRKHEDFLANIDQGYQRDSVEFHNQGRQPGLMNHLQQARQSVPNPGINRKNRWDIPPEAMNNDRKRPRHEDYPLDPTAKSSKPLQKADDNGSIDDEPQHFESEMLHTGQSKDVLQQKNTVEFVASKPIERMSYQDKSPLDNASDSILERAERLCKELREKREASSNQRANLVKTQTHHSINDKMNNLKKTKQSYLKGHITNRPTDQASSGDNASTISESAISSASTLAHKLKEPSSQSKPPASSSKVKTLDEIRKSIEQSVLDDSRSASSESRSVPSVDKVRSRIRTSSLTLSETSTNVQSHCTGQTKGKADSVSGSDGKPSRPYSKVDSATNCVGSKAGPKQPISKENLNKMVNCPRSRTERVQLARMFQSRADKTPSAQVSSRSNINLEGLYDSPDIADLEIDVGGSMPTIKLEELSDDIRSQILGLIQGDIGITPSSSKSKQRQPVEIIDVDGDTPTKDVSSHNDRHIEKNSTNERLNRKSASAKMSSKNKVIASSTSETQSSSVPQNPISNPEFLSKTRKEGYAKASLHKDPKDSEAYRLAKKLTSAGTDINKKSTSDKVNSVSTKEQDSTSPRLTRDNVLSRFPTILGTPLTNSASSGSGEKGVLPLMDNGRDIDSGRSSMSLSSSSVAISTSSLTVPSQSSFLSSMPPSNSTLQPTISASSALTPSTPIEEAVNLLNNCPPFTRESSKEQGDVRSSIVASLGSDVSSNTMSELLALSEQEESVKQEMMSMELRLTRLHRLLEQAVYQINKCTERRNELQDEEKSLSSRRMTLLREATSTAHQESQSGTTTTTAKSTSTTTAPSERPTSQPSSVLDLPPTTQPQSNESHEGHSSLSKSEWLAKFSAYLPSDFIASRNESNTNSTSLSPPQQISETHQNKNNHSVSSRSSINPRFSSDSAHLQMVPERDLETTRNTESYVSFNNSTSLQNESEPSVSGVRDKATEDTIPYIGPSTAHEFTSPIMYVGTIKSGTAQSAKSDKPAPVMMLNSATISSLFNSGSGENVNPVKIVGLGDQMDSEKGIPQVVRRPSLGSPRQEDSDIGSIASVASGSSLGEQISRYCRYTPGASADGQNPHDLSVILSGPSDTSDLRGLEEDDDNFGDSQMRPGVDDGDKEKVVNLKEDAGNNRLYGRLDQESIKSAEALHLIERNNDVPSSSSLDRKKKKRKTKQQRDSGIRGRPKPYVISSSSADERDANKTGGESCVSNLEQRLRKSPESTDGDSSDQPNVRERQPLSQSGSRLSSPTKGDHGTEITIAECDSSTNLGIVDTQSLNDSSNRLKEMNESFEKTFGRKPRDRSSFYKDSQDQKDDVVILSDDNNEGQTPNVIDLCNEDDVNSSLSVRSYSLLSQKSSRYPTNLGPVCYIHCLEEKIYAGYLNNGFKVFDMKSEDYNSAKHYPIPRLLCMEVLELGGRDGMKVCVGSGHSIVVVDTETGTQKKIDLGTTVKCLHFMKNHLFAGLDTGEICVYEIKLWKEIDRYICADSAIHCMASGSEAGTRVLCVASLDGTITVVDADRCLPLRMLTAHNKTAFSVQVYLQHVFSCSGDSKVIIHNLHTARVEKEFKDNKGIVNSVFYSQSHLYTGGFDRLVRVYNVKNYKLVQVYFGAGMGPIKSIHVHQNKLLITGNTVGSVDVVELDLKAKNVCKHKNCGLNFGLASHLAWHIEEAH